MFSLLTFTAQLTFSPTHKHTNIFLIPWSTFALSLGTFLNETEFHGDDHVHPSLDAHRCVDMSQGVLSLSLSRDALEILKLKNKRKNLKCTDAREAHCQGSFRASAAVGVKTECPTCPCTQNTGDMSGHSLWPPTDQSVHVPGHGSHHW